jgi:hypothetical protein
MVIWENRLTMGENPASVEMNTGNIILNRDVFPKYPKFTQQFILEHERGHFNIPTDNEAEADLYALKKLYKSTGKSLKKTMQAITDFLDNNDPRVMRMYQECLKIDVVDNKNEKAVLELENLIGMREKQGSYNSPFIRNFVNETENKNTSDQTLIENGRYKEISFERMHATRFVNIFGIHFRVIELILIAFLFTILFRRKY